MEFFFVFHSWKLPSVFFVCAWRSQGIFRYGFLSMTKIRWLKEYIKIAKEAKHDKDWLVSGEHKVVLPCFAIRRSNQPKFERRWWFHRRICRFCGSPNFIVTISSWAAWKMVPLAKVQTLSAKDAGKQRESGLLVNGCESSRERWKWLAQLNLVFPTLHNARIYFMGLLGESRHESERNQNGAASPNIIPRESSANAMAKEQQKYHFIAQYNHHITLIFPSYNRNFSYFHIFSTPQPTSLTVAWQVELMKKRLASMIHSQSSRAEASSFFLGFNKKEDPWQLKFGGKTSLSYSFEHDAACADDASCTKCSSLFCFFP